MGSLKLLRCVFISVAIYLLLIHGNSLVMGATPSNTVAEAAHRNRGRPFLRLAARPANQYARIKPEIFNDLIVDDDDLFDLSKRQNSDDYGHLRFGKREDFDDYGHMRFGRSGD